MWGRRSHVAIISVAVGDYVLCDGIYIGGRHGSCHLRELTDDRHLIGRFRDVVWDQELVVISGGVVWAATKSLLEMGQLHFG